MKDIKCVGFESEYEVYSLFRDVFNQYRLMEKGFLPKTKGILSDGIIVHVHETPTQIVLRKQ